MEDTNFDLPSLDLVLSQTTINSTVDLTKFLRTTSRPLQHRLVLAWCIQDSTKVDGSKEQKDTIGRLCTILIRKHEVLVEWITSVMWREIKTTTTSKTEYQLYRDPAAINLLVAALHSINDSQKSMDIQSLLGNGPFLRLFIDGLAHSMDIVYMAALAELWRFIVEQTKDGMEVLSAKPEALVQLLTTVGNQYLSTVDTDVEELQTLLLNFLSSLSLVMRNAFESTISPRKCFGLFDQNVLPLCLRLVATIPEPCGTIFLDMIQAGLFHVDPMKKFITELFDHKQNPRETQSTYVAGFFDIISKATPEVIRQYASALPYILFRFLQAAGLVCAETRNQVTTTVGLSAVAANPINRSRDDISNVCLRMFEIMYGWLEPLCKEYRDIMGPVNRLVGAYYQDPCFGTNNKANIVSSQTYQSQIKHLEGWLTTIVYPELNSSSEPVTLTESLEGVSIALNARPDSVQQTIGDQMVAIFGRIPTSVVESATRVLKHLVETMAKTRQLDVLFEKITRVSIISSPGYVNLLESETFIRTLNQCVSHSMPFAQILKCLEISVDAIIQAVDGSSSSSSSKKKKRKLSKDGKSDVSPRNIGSLVTITANFALSSINTVVTEHQRGQYFDLISDKYKTLVRKTLADPAYGWERMLLHYTFMEIGARMDGTARWLEKSMDPERVHDKILDLSSNQPRTHALAMAVGFQMAAHWSGLVSSVSAGVSKMSKPTDERSQMVQKTICELLKGLQMAKSMGEWNGQIQDITDRNGGTAEWTLVKDWLELICEYADDSAIRTICTRIVADMMATDPLNQQQGLLGQARFFEISAIRQHLVPSLLSYANTRWQQDTANHGKSSTRLVGQITSALTRLKDPAQSPQRLVEMVINSIDEADDKKKLPSAIASPWIQLIGNLLRFPTTYWTHHHQIVGLALIGDLGISQTCQSSEDTLRLQQYSQALLERVLRQHHSSATLLLDTKQTLRLIDRWQPLDNSPGGGLLQLVVQSVAKAAFGHSNQQADQVCRQVCKHMVEQQGVCALATLGMVSRIANHNSQKLADNKQQSGEWKELAKPWFKHYQKRVLKTNSLYDLGMYMAAHDLYTGMNKSKTEKKQAEIIQHLVSQMTDTKPDSEYVLGLMFVLVRLEVGSKAPRCVPKLLAHMIKCLSVDNPQPMSPTLQSLINQQQISLDTAIIQSAAIPLLRQVSGEIFTASFNNLLVNLKGNGTVRLLPAYIQTAYRPDTTSTTAVAKRKSVQRQLGCLLSALHAALDSSTSLPVIQITSDLILEASLRFSTSDIGQVLSLIHTTLSISGIPATQAQELFAALCKLLGSILRYHSEQSLTSISLITELIRTLLHAFVAPDSPHHHTAGSGTPWILSQAPLPAQSAHAYARMVVELTNIKKTNSKQQQQQQQSQMLVKDTKGTSTTSASSLLSLYIPVILAEYCVIQGGAARHGNQITSQATGSYRFLGLCWQSAPIVVPTESPPTTSAGTAGIIGNPLVRDALMPGWHALLDIVSNEDRVSLLTLLASPPPPPSLSLKGGCTGSVFGPVRYGGADEVLKSLYQNYQDFYKYSGQI